MKKTTILLAALLFSVTGAFASGESDKESVRTVSLSGQVIDDATGEALAGVKVELEGTQEHYYTDFEGYFTIQGLIPGTYCINTSMISYENAEQHVDIDYSDRIQVKLEQVKK
ncbi:MAG: carboxypeptidase-like regulatory domain-containing protein [Bacteroidales bacterium]